MDLTVKAAGKHLAVANLQTKNLQCQLIGQVDAKFQILYLPKKKDLLPTKAAGFMLPQH
jgi:hypothetical protein